MNNQTELHKTFISKLEIYYGPFSPENNRFQSTSNSKIARDLFYSDSQFSRLINNTASEGELQRALANVERLLKVNSLQQKIDKIQNSRSHPGMALWKKWAFIGVTTGIIALMALFLLRSMQEGQQRTMPSTSRYEMLKWSFENNYIRPYITLKELPEDCYFPCYKYQGRWELDKEYKIPFFRERNGFHYVAKQATMYATCSDKTATSGELFEGYEYQKHEIWYDLREFPIDSFLVKGSKTAVRPAYNEAVLEEDPNFVKLAYVHTFFKTAFHLDSTSIQRTGKTIGRDIEFLPENAVISQLESKELLNELKTEINAIARNRLEDFSKPVMCNPATAPKEDFNLIEEGDILSFDCQFSTGRFLVGYTKNYVLEDQYINNYCR
ncbi:hypothetical protein [Galbibacter pacificus]|uniref:DUF3298 domain-containing protein n=1 Tax=Galbibacter pacificus TaxID=2996052 RepID=A0ABT6FRU2_9FLAO|nr:hypothetical protein [Galbibacter pacificus]MDG3582898.1 hypothetical protein [Galbibacter pacificus]MDG3585983.1 hypothetical protein [Galbibacter pacificus]